MIEWPFGLVWYWCTGHSGQFGSDVLALRSKGHSCQVSSLCDVICTNEQKSQESKISWESISKNPLNKIPFKKIHWIILWEKSTQKNIPCDPAILKFYPVPRDRAGSRGIGLPIWNTDRNRRWAPKNWTTEGWPVKIGLPNLRTDLRGSTYWGNSKSKVKLETHIRTRYRSSKSKLEI